MTALNNLEEDHDSELLRLLASLDLWDARPHSIPPATPPPRTPSLLPPPYTEPVRHTFPTVRSRTYTATSGSTLYHFESPTRRGYTIDWCSESFHVAGGCRYPGVPNATVHAFHPSRSKKKRPKKAYVVFCGTQCGVFLSWDITKSLVSRVCHSLFRGYGTMAEAHAAFAYAEACSWTRIANTRVTAIPALPQPVAFAPFDAENPLNGAEELDDRWFIVYRGICPGVYRSHLECQLNTLGVSGALHEAIEGKEAAQAKFRAAVACGSKVAVVSPVYTEVGDPFI
ncbi:hypothetical protein B0H19DRAFT_1261386 [Mycena capillaripes]|nr:hypothetical protein B0H19DRAFT_1261386 [Mycena capillaripes]